jgi:putative ABC transport system permease protein
LFSAVIMEAASIAALGAVAGYAVYAVILTTVASVVRTQTGVVLETLRWDAVLVAAPVTVILLGALAGCIPAIKAYRTDVAQNLTPH